MNRPLLDVVIAHPANAGLRGYLEPRHQRPSLPALAFPDDLERPYESLGTHPDLVARLWDELGATLPQDCRAVFYGTPALVHPQSGVAFGFAGGTHTYALRLPEAERLEALRAGASRLMRYPGERSLDLDAIGTDWLFGNWHRAEPGWCRAAYERAGDM